MAMRPQSSPSFFGIAACITLGLGLLAGCDPKKESPVVSGNPTEGTIAKGTENVAPDAGSNMPSPDPKEVEAQRKFLKEKSQPPTGAFNVDEHGKGKWKSEPDKAAKLAKSIDAKLNNIKNSIMQARMFLEIPKQGVGRAETINIIRDAKRYQLKFPMVSNVKKSEMSSVDIIAKDNKIFTVGQETTVPSRQMPPAMTLEQFGYNFSSYIASGILTKEAPFSKLISLARAQKWSIKTDATTQNGIHSTRLLLKSPKKDSVYELIISDDKGYPTTIRTTFGPGANKTKLAWFGFWAFKPTTLVEEDFKMTTETSPIASHPAPREPAPTGPGGAKTN